MFFPSSPSAPQKCCFLDPTPYKKIFFFLFLLVPVDCTLIVKGATDQTKTHRALGGFDGWKKSREWWYNEHTHVATGIDVTSFAKRGSPHPHPTLPDSNPNENMWYLLKINSKRWRLLIWQDFRGLIQVWFYSIYSKCINIKYKSLYCTIIGKWKFEHYPRLKMYTWAYIHTFTMRDMNKHENFHYSAYCCAIIGNESASTVTNILFTSILVPLFAEWGMCKAIKSNHDFCPN